MPHRRFSLFDRDITRIPTNLGEILQTIGKSVDVLILSTRFVIEEQDLISGWLGSLRFDGPFSAGVMPRSRRWRGLLLCYRKFFFYASWFIFGRGKFIFAGRL
jgi:hypothetical protein